MAFAWDIFAEEIGRVGQRAAAGIRQRAADIQIEERAKNLARFSKQLDFDALKQELEYKAGFDGLQYSVSKDLQGMAPEEAQRIQASVIRARSGYPVGAEEFTGLSDLTQAKIADLLRTHGLKSAELKVRQDRIQLERDQIERDVESAREKAEKKAYEEETKEIETEEKKKHDKSATLLKNAKSRLEKERSNLATKSKPSQAEALGGALPAQKIAFAKELENVENALDFISNAESYIAGGLPLRKSQESFVKLLVGDIKKLRSGETLKRFKTEMQKRGKEAIDEYGFFIGEQREDINGVLQEYIGNDRWRQVK